MPCQKHLRTLSHIALGLVYKISNMSGVECVRSICFANEGRPPIKVCSAAPVGWLSEMEIDGVYVRVGERAERNERTNAMPVLTVNEIELPERGAFKAWLSLWA